MKLDDVRKMAKFKLTHTPDDQKRIQDYLRTLGIEPGTLYQELEMSSAFVNTHRDTSYSDAHVSLHSHDYMEILYCRTDCGVEYLVGSNRYRLQKGDIIVVPPEVSHRPILPERMYVPYVRDVLWISRTFLEGVAQMFPDTGTDRRDYSIPIRTVGTRWEFIGELFHNGVREEEERRPGWETAVLGNTLMIFAHLKRAYLERGADAMEAETPELPDRIAAYIEEWYASHITVDDLARRFYVSNSTISHQFKQKMGTSLYHYITQRRLIAAKSLIQQGSLLEDVASEVGFADYSTFYRAFKQEFGISPRQFARK